MKKFLANTKDVLIEWIATFALIGVLLLPGLIGGGCTERTSADLGESVKGTEIMFLIANDSDWSSTGPVVDIQYQLVPMSYVEKLWRERAFTEDCDDYAGEMWRTAVNGPGRPAFGMVTTSSLQDGKVGGHALNFFVAPDRSLWLYEPQNGRAWKPSKETKWSLSYHWM